MRKLTRSRDVDGRAIERGDTVATIGDNFSARIGDICREGDTDFVLLRSPHQTYLRGIWHPADQVQRIASARKRSA